ncbi:TrbI/VirB10 family protein [Persephonella sp. KM09-Lau-8]|uniref:TrbI/VirB10 family protein n=1 Tax=Persephonella sp. KM09-Lau-8 TaxID=1158345 RepID=UPI00068A2061|nr:TrbI/VirB10 family protein [Persephonella sp. KM09-Lau-8]
MEWKKPNFSFGKKKEEKKEAVESEDKNIHPEDAFEAPEDEQVSPYEQDVSAANRKKVFFLAIVGIIFGVIVIFVANSRQQAKKPVDKEIKSPVEAVPEDFEDKSLENARVLALEKKIEELEKQLNEKKSSNKPVSTLADKQTSNTATKPSQNSSNVSNNSNSSSYTTVSKKELVPLPPPDVDSDNDVTIDIKPDVPAGGMPRGQKKVVYTVQVLDDPVATFQEPTVNVSAGTKVASVSSTPSVSEYSSATSGVKPQKGSNPVGQKQKETSQTSSKKKEETRFVFPAGSFFRIVLLNGVDAPTGMKGKAIPTPVLGRVLSASILPNGYKANLKGCFVIGDAKGDLSSQRVYIRITKLSCVTKTGKILQKSMSGYVNGEDGKTGFIGRVVSREGAVLARVLFAKFVEGIGNAFQQSTYTTSISPLGTTQTIDPNEATKAAIYSGVSGAAKELSDYFLKLADQIFPVVEVNAGRQGDVIILKKLVIDTEKDLVDEKPFIEKSQNILEDEVSPEEKVFRAPVGE